MHGDLVERVGRRSGHLLLAEGRATGNCRMYDHPVAQAATDPSLTVCDLPRLTVHFLPPEGDRAPKTELPAPAKAEPACFACFFLPLTAAPPERLPAYMTS